MYCIRIYIYIVYDKTQLNTAKNYYEFQILFSRRDELFM